VGISSSEPGFIPKTAKKLARRFTEYPITSKEPRGNQRHARIFGNQKKIITANLRLSLRLEPPEFVNSDS
jgi:hypothetical protein